MIKLYLFALALASLLTLSCNGGSSKKDPAQPESEKTEVVDADTGKEKDGKQDSGKPKKPENVVVTHTAIMKTSMGAIEFALYGKDAPNAVENFVTLAKRGYYDGVLFHRVAKNFVVQAGDPLTKDSKVKSEWGSGGESIFGAGFDVELNPKSPLFKQGYSKGTLAMANRGPGTNTSQFFICLSEAAKLEREWTIFGRVIKGMEVVEAIGSAEVEPGPRGKNDGIPKIPIKIYSIKTYKETK